MIHTQTYARVGLIGNPSDGYYGKTISAIVRNFSARVTLFESPRLMILPHRSDRSEFLGLEDLVQDVRDNGYYGGIRLIKASIKRFYDHCIAHEHPLGNRTFSIEYTSDIPVRVGMAGSSAIVTATLKALMQFFGIHIPKEILPTLALSVELDELGIGAGLQDRVIQIYEGVQFMDFDRTLITGRGYGAYEELDSTLLPPLFVVYREQLAEGTEVPHNDLRARFNRKEPIVLDAMKRFAALAQKARDLIVAGRGKEIGPLMDENFNLRSSLLPISAGNLELIKTGRGVGASVKFAGSGGTLIGTYDGDPDRWKRICKVYSEIGAKVFIPQIEPDSV
jgi:glucuronokinase